MIESITVLESTPLLVYLKIENAESMQRTSQRSYALPVVGCYSVSVKLSNCFFLKELLKELRKENGCG